MELNDQPLLRSGKRKQGDNNAIGDRSPTWKDKKLQDMTDDEKRAYNRNMSARARKRQKDTISGLNQQIQDFMHRNGKLEQISNAFASMSSALVEENRRLRQYIVDHMGGVAPPQVDATNSPLLAAVLGQLRGLVPRSPDLRHASPVMRQSVSQQSLIDGLKASAIDSLASHQHQAYTNTFEPPSGHPVYQAPATATATSIPAAVLNQALATRRAETMLADLLAVLQQLYAGLNSQAKVQGGSALEN